MSEGRRGQGILVNICTDFCRPGLHFAICISESFFIFVLSLE